MQVPLSIFSVPKTGRATVRFLGNPRGILTHFKKPPSRACPGPEMCKDHFFPQWKGYAPVQLWVSEQKHWKPVVLEMTEGLVEVIGHENLRGRCFRVDRQKNDFAGQVCRGVELDGYSPDQLPAPFDVVSAVERMYGTFQIEWDVSPQMFLRSVAEISTDGPPSKDAGEVQSDAERDRLAAIYESRRKKAEESREKRKNSST